MGLLIKPDYLAELQVQERDILLSEEEARINSRPRHLMLHYFDRKFKRVKPINIDTLPQNQREKILEAAKSYFMRKIIKWWTLAFLVGGIPLLFFILFFPPEIMPLYILFEIPSVCFFEVGWHHLQVLVHPESSRLPSESSNSGVTG